MHVERGPDSQDLKALLVVISVLAICAKLATTWIRVRRTRANFIKSHGCQPAKSWYPHVRFMFGFDWVIMHVSNIWKREFARSVYLDFRRYGTTYVAQAVTKPVISTIDPENLEALMRTSFQDYDIIPARRKLICTVYGNGVFATNGTDWRHSRELVHTGMAQLNYDPSTFDEHATSLINVIKSHGDKTIDFAKLVNQYTLDLTTALFFGESTKILSRKGTESSRRFAEDFSVLEKMTEELTVFVNQIPFLPDIMYGRTFRSKRQSVWAFVDSQIEKAREELDVDKHRFSNTSPKDSTTQKRKSLVHGLALNSVDKQRVRSEILNLLLAGTGTVATTLGEIVYWIAREPSSWTKLRVEVEETLHGERPSLRDLKRMPYLSYTINEAMRMTPTISVHGRTALRDTALPRGGGEDGTASLFVPKGAYVAYSNYALHRDPKVFGPDVEKFRPDRWAGTSRGQGELLPSHANETTDSRATAVPLKPARFEYLSFGAGPRHCPGEKMGWNMVAYVTVRLAQAFKAIEPRDDRSWEEARAFIFQNRHGVHVGMIPE